MVMMGLDTGPGDYLYKAGLWRVTRKYPGKAREDTMYKSDGSC